MQDLGPIYGQQLEVRSIINDGRLSGAADRSRAFRTRLDGTVEILSNDFSSADANNPGNTGYAYANALLGNFTSYQESTTRPGGGGLANIVEGFAQDTWRATPKLTLDYGLRLAYYTHYRHESGGAAAFSLERYNAAKAPRLYYPALVNGVRLGRDLATGATVPAVLVGALVPGTGDLTNGLVLASDTSYPQGFKEQPPIFLPVAILRGCRGVGPHQECHDW